MKRFLIFILSLIMLITFISCKNSDKVPDGYEVYYGYVEGVSDTYILAYISEVGDDTNTRMVKIDVPSNHTFRMFDTVRVVAKPDDFYDDSGLHTQLDYGESFDVEYGKSLKEYYSIRLSDWEKGEPLYG